MLGFAEAERHVGTVKLGLLLASELARRQQQVLQDVVDAVSILLRRPVSPPPPPAARDDSGGAPPGRGCLHGRQVCAEGPPGLLHRLAWPPAWPASHLA